MTVKLHAPSPPPAPTSRSICSTGKPRFCLTIGPVCLSEWNSRLPTGRVRRACRSTSAAHWASLGRGLVASRGEPGPLGSAPPTWATGVPPSPDSLTPGGAGALPVLPGLLVATGVVDGLDGSSSPKSPPKYAATRMPTARSAIPTPTKRTMLDFFFGRDSSPSSDLARALPALFLLATAVLPPAAPFRSAPPAAPSSSSPGASTTKRYLHFGQSIFFPMSEAFLMVTIASQLGHWTLNPVVAAIRRPPQ